MSGGRSETLALIGYGAVARTVLRALRNAPETRDYRFMVLCEAGHRATAQDALKPFGVEVVEDIAAIINAAPKLVAECASAQAVRQEGPEILRAGIPLIIISVAALADAETEKSLRQAAAASAASVTVPAGAIGGIDALAAARLAGLDSVTYRSRKPPKAWTGTPAEEILDLDGLAEATVFYKGAVRQAAGDYPRNVNVAATVALAGLGFETTAVELIADPGVTENIHEVHVQGAAGHFDIRLVGHPSQENPKTSALTGFSVARAILNKTGCFEI